MGQPSRGHTHVNYSVYIFGRSIILHGYSPHIVFFYIDQTSYSSSSSSSVLFRARIILLDHLLFAEILSCSVCSVFVFERAPVVVVFTVVVAEYTRACVFVSAR